MTVIAFLGLRRCPEYRVVGGVKLMTACAADFVILMWTTVPGETGIGFVTSEAHLVLRRDACDRIGGESYYRRPLASAPHPAGMCATRTVACFTLQLTLTERAARIRRHRMLCLKHGKDRLITVTGKAGIGALAAVWNIGCRFALSLCPADH